jgi:hypothetical protein
MTMDNHENQPMGREPENDAVHGQQIDASRRRFTRLGLGASGVVMTLTSRSVLAQSVCKSPSGFLSNNASQHGDPAFCSGTDPAGWAATSQWPIDKNTTFSSVFGVTTAAWTKKTKMSFFDAPLTSGTTSSSSQGGAGNGQSAKANGVGSETEATLYDVLTSNTTPPVVRYLVAAYLNAVGNLNAFPTTTQVLQIYNEWTSTGRYEVSAGIYWYDTDIITYLQSTMGVAIG